MNNPLIINLFPSTLSREKIIFLFILLLILTLNGCKTVNYSDTNLMELCREHIAEIWNDYVEINRKEYNSKGYFVAVVGEDGRCEQGMGPTQKDAFNDCTHWKIHHNIIGTCELYARGEEVVWKKKETVNYSDTNLMELCREHIAEIWNDYVEINRKEYNSKGYFVAVVGEDGRCEQGMGPTQKDAFNDCTHWKIHHNIIGTCELYARGEEIVWRGVNEK